MACSAPWSKALPTTRRLAETNRHLETRFIPSVARRIGNHRDNVLGGGPGSLPWVGRLFDFHHERRDGLNVYVSTAGDDDLIGPLWPGLRPPYPDEPLANPWLRFGVNNTEGEDLAVWRALAWALTTSRERYAVPVFDRDLVAGWLQVPREEMVLVAWEYRVDLVQDPSADADLGFVTADTCVRIAPPPDAWELEHKNEAGLFHLSSLADLTTVDNALGFDVTSQVSIFGIDPRAGRAAWLVDGLRRPVRPELDELLEPSDVFVHLAVVRDRFLGYTSYFTVAAHGDIGARLDALVDNYELAYARYADRAPLLEDFEDFAAAVEELVSEPPAVGGTV
jgi:hypothetical protein